MSQSTCAESNGIPFKIAAIQVDELKMIVWANPDKIEEEKPIEWLKNGANPESDRFLGNWCDH